MNRRVPANRVITLGVGACVMALVLLPCAPLSRVPQHAEGHRAMHRFIAATASADVLGAAQAQTQAPELQAPTPPQPDTQTQQPQTGSGTYTDSPWPRSSKLRIRVIDGRTLKPLSGAEVVVIESEQRVRTDQDGLTPWFDAPLIRDPRYRPLVSELHGQIGVIAYKNGYRDSVHLGIRMNPNVRAETTVWMYKLGPGDDRIEPVLYEVPYHHLWLVRLADRFRDSSQLGEGFQHP